MNAPAQPPEPAVPATDAAALAPLPAPPLAAQAAPDRGRIAALAIAAIAVAALAAAVLVGQRLGHLREQLARQTAEAQSQAGEARAAARRAEDLVRETAARQAVADARISEVALQRTQLEALMQSLSRSRDETLVVDIESALRLAQQQAQLTGSTEPLLLALRNAAERIERAAQPRLVPLARAVARDTDRVKAAAGSDTLGVLARLDELARMADELPIANAVGGAAPPAGRTPHATPAGAAPEPWWQRTLLPLWQAVQAEARGLVRVRRIDHPDAALLAPEQAFFLRENWKLKLLNARLAVLARQHDAARADVQAAAALLGRWFDPSARRTQQAAALLGQLLPQLQAPAATPRLDDTLAALGTAAAGR